MTHSDVGDFSAEQSEIQYFRAPRCDSFTFAHDCFNVRLIFEAAYLLLREGGIRSARKISSHSTRTDTLAECDYCHKEALARAPL